MRERSASFVFAAALLQLSSGCSGDNQSWFYGNRLWESEHFRYHSYADDESVCEGVLDTLEQHFRRTHEYLGFAGDPGAKVDYYKFRTEDEFSRLANCPTNSSGCGGAHRVRTSLAVHQHELVHGYFDADGLYPPSFLAEGLATAMSCEFSRESGLDSWREAIENTTAQNPYLGDQGAWLIGHLLKHYPRETFLSWYDAVHESDSAEHVGEAFEAAYGVSLDAMWEEVSAFAGRTVQCVLLDECSAPALLFDGTPTTVGFACDGSNQFRSIDVSEATNLVFQQDSSDLNQLSSCSELPALTARLSSATRLLPQTTVVRLEPGKYTFGVPGYRSEARVEVRARSAPELGLTSSCSDAEAFALEEAVLGQTAILNLTLPPGAAGDARFVRIAPGSGMYLEVEDSSQVATTQCAGCTGDCEPTHSRAALPLDASGAATLRIERLEASPWATQVTLVWRPPRGP